MKGKMYYSGYGILAAVLHVIINYDAIKNSRINRTDPCRYRYRQFLCSIFLFYLADLTWGITVESGMRGPAYADTVAFFATQALSVLLWTRYVATFLEKKSRLTGLLLGAGWLIFGFVILHLIVNFFNPIIFDFSSTLEYKPGIGRYLIMVFQFLLFVFVAAYSLIVTFKSEGRDRVRYAAICLSGGVMTILIALQTVYTLVPFYTIGCFIANCIFHVFVEENEKREQNLEIELAEKEKNIYTHIAGSLAEDYDAIYYIDIESGKYREISTSSSYDKLNVSPVGDDFYTETRKNAAKYAHPDDREFAVSLYYKDVMLKNLEGRKTYSYNYRIMVDGESRYYSFTVMMADDGKHFVFCDKDIHETITAETAALEKQKINITFTQIAESLASNYDVIYYVDVESQEYVEFTSKNIYGELIVDRSGDDFFSQARNNALKIVHPRDREKLLKVLDIDYLISALEGKKQFDFEYRLIIDDRSRYTRLSARKSSDGGHFIICVENIDDEVQREKEVLRALNTEKELARRDELTGTKNKTAFTELEQSVQNNIDNGIDYLPFAIVVCDLNDLKKINDTEGHMSGDEYIKASAKVLCDIFDHSPVFRIGGDEFAVFLRGDDYSQRKELLDVLRKKVIDNLKSHEGPVIAFGMAEFEQNRDKSISEIFERADRQMYEDKRRLKEMS